jgi:Rrf2 family nitric oxide-sensitive transcriptional repressor
MRLTLYTDYSLRVLIYLANKEDENVTITELADFYQISRNHLVKVVHSLGLDGYILTTRGRHGGLKLARPAKEILIGKVIRSTEPDFDLLECSNPVTDKCVISRSCSARQIYAGRYRQGVKENHSLVQIHSHCPQLTTGKDRSAYGT